MARARAEERREPAEPGDNRAAAPAGAAGAPGAREWLALLLVLAGTVVLDLPALRTQFFADDFLFLDQVRGRSLWASLLAPDPLSNFFRPVSRQLWFWALGGLTHESPLAFRVGNLVLLLVAITLLFLLVRRLAGPRAAVFASAFVALHYAADVPVRWACGSQELFAVAGALAAILLHVSGRRVAAGAAMLVAALSKEVVLLAPLVAVLADRAPGERWTVAARRAWPLGAAVLVWAAIFLAMPHRRAAQGMEVEFDLLRSPLAALAHLVQVVGGLEWGAAGAGAMLRTPPPLLPLAAALAAVLLVWRAGPPPADGGRGRPAPRRVLLLGAAWALIAAAPVAAVTLLWSAYYYLFAMCGVALVLGVWLARAPAPAACVALAALAWGSANGRELADFGIGRDAWTSASHINRAYIERSNRVTDDYLASLRRAVPRFPSGSTVFFGGLLGNVAFQRGDGPLLRWAFRDTSLRSHYLNAFSRATARPGPLYFFLASGDTLVEMTPGPDLYLRVAFGMILSEQPAGARDALEVAAQRAPDDPRAAYWAAWVARALGDGRAAGERLARAGYAGDGAPAPAGERDAVLARFAAGDTAAAVARMRGAVRSRPLDPAAHALLADLLLVRDHTDPDGAIEAYAARVLAPDDPYAWRRWATLQASRQRPYEALASFQRYFRLGGAAAAADSEAHRYAASLRASIPRESAAAEPVPE